MKRLMLFTIMLLSALVSQAQATVSNENFMEQNGKIYVVVAVVVVILIGLFLYVWSIDRKIKKMED